MCKLWITIAVFFSRLKASLAATPYMLKWALSIFWRWITTINLANDYGLHISCFMCSYDIEFESNVYHLRSLMGDGH